MRGLFLDDERWPEDVTWLVYPASLEEWTIVRTHHDFERELLREASRIVYDVISFDHDICCVDERGSEVTGYDCLKTTLRLVEDRKIVRPIIHFHTRNIVGLNNMVGYYHDWLHRQMMIE